MHMLLYGIHICKSFIHTITKMDMNSELQKMDLWFWKISWLIDIAGLCYVQ